MNRQCNKGLLLRRGAALAMAMLTTLACEDLNLSPLPGARYKGEKPWVTAAIDVLLDVYPRTEDTGVEYCGMLCQEFDEQVFATQPIQGTKTKCSPWKSPCPKDTKAIGTYHTHAIGPIDETNPKRPFSEEDIEGTEPYDFLAQALTPRSNGKLDISIYQFERGIQTVGQVYPVVIWPFPPLKKK